MHLDKTRIAIRERGFLDTLDIALRVIRFHALPLAVLLLATVAPLWKFNEWLIGWMTEHPDPYEGHFRYTWNLVLLVFIEAPLATVPITLYLGAVMFLEKTTPRQILNDCWKSTASIFVCLILFRGVGPALLLATVIHPEDGFSPAETFLTLLALYLAIVRALRPYVNEIILLERNPLRANKGRAMTVGRRSSVLHGPNSGDLLGRWIGSAGIAVLMTTALTFTFWFGLGAFLNEWDWGPLMTHVFAPAAMWIVAGFFGVVRFLSYLDLRIRREGWEVELQVRAEAVRIGRQKTS